MWSPSVLITACLRSGEWEVTSASKYPTTPSNGLFPEAYDVVFGFAKLAQLFQQYCGIVVAYLNALAVRVNLIHEVSHVRPWSSSTRRPE